MKVMLERDQLQCVPVVGLSEWARKMEGEVEPMELFVDGKTEFKLGEVINIVAFYYPDHNKLYFVRKVAQEEVLSEQLEPIRGLANPQLDYSQVRQELLSYFSAYCS
jgi:hypothetical protein